MTAPFRRLLLVAALCGAAVACARVVLPIATPADVARAGERWPGTTASELARGRSLYAGHCGSCHRPVAPESRAAEEWPAHVHEMQGQAKLSDEQARLVVRYLVTMAGRRASPHASAAGGEGAR